MIIVKNGKTQLKGSAVELVGEVYSILASPELLKLVTDYKDGMEQIKEASKELLELGKLVGANKESCEATKLIEARLDVGNFLVKTVMEAITIGESIKNANRV